jgi:hypothetical protein
MTADVQRAPVLRPARPVVATARRVPGDLWAYVGGVVLGATLLLVAAVRQPFSYDELSQITPYASNDVVTIVSGTRQPPLDPLLGAVFRHLLGQGQLQQRLVPVLAGIGILVVAGALLRRLGLGYAGAWAVWVLATAPLAVRYGAYTRPYALPALWMLLFVLASHVWLTDRRRGWLAVAVATAVALPLTRVPEPCVFLAVTFLALSLASWTGRMRWRDTRPLVLAAGGSLVLVGVPLFLLLGSQTQGSFFDPSPAGMWSRAGRGFHEIATAVVPLLGQSFPWWPLSLAVVLVGLAVPSLRRRLLGWWFWWALLAAPVAFVLAYHLLNPYSFFALPYRSRAAYFFLPAYVLVTAVVASLVTTPRLGRGVRAAVGLLLAGALVGQLPATAGVLTRDAAPDFATASALLRTHVPQDAVVLYDRPTPAGQSRQPFLGHPRYLGARPRVLDVRDLADRRSLPSGPVYVLVNGQCARPGRCQLSRRPWVRDVPGWRLAATSERFSLYGPVGRSGGIERALLAFGRTLGPDLGYVETLSAATLVERGGDPAGARDLVADLRSRMTPLQQRRMDDYVASNNVPVPH